VIDAMDGHVDHSHRGSGAFAIPRCRAFRLTVIRSLTIFVPNAPIPAQVGNEYVSSRHPRLSTCSLVARQFIMLMASTTAIGYRVIRPDAAVEQTDIMVSEMSREVRSAQRQSREPRRRREPCSRCAAAHGAAFCRCRHLSRSGSTPGSAIGVSKSPSLLSPRISVRAARKCAGSYFARSTRTAPKR